MLMIIQNDILGWAAFIVAIFSCSYILLKRLKMHNRNFKINLRKLLGCHCYLGIIATIIAFIHVGDNLYSISFTPGYVSLFFMVLLSISGIILKYMKGHKKIWRYIHIVSAIIFAISLMFHILEYHFFS